MHVGWHAHQLIKHVPMNGCARGCMEQAVCGPSTHHAWRGATAIAAATAAAAAVAAVAAVAGLLPARARDARDALPAGGRRLARRRAHPARQAPVCRGRDRGGASYLAFLILLLLLNSLHWSLQASGIRTAQRLERNTPPKHLKHSTCHPK